jgi:hypothetical protein
MFSVLIAGRAAIRIFFVITPFFCFSVAYFLVNLIEYSKNNKEETLRFILWSMSIIVILLIFISSMTFYDTINGQARYTGVSANPQWQNAMNWVRGNTPQDSLFVHWWDYGYWVQYLGERPTVTDGGHFCKYWDYLIGRYLLTTPNPESALSYMKTLNVSYLLIDPTDLGKYPAYASIGSDDNYDRMSAIIPMVYDSKQTWETSTSIVRVYSGQYGVDEDIIINDTLIPGPNYNEMNQPMFKSYVIGVSLEMQGDVIQQPIGIFMYKGIQYRIPLRYVYFNGMLYDFHGGLESGVRIIPGINADGSYVNNMGALIYLSPRLFNSLVGQLYLMDDPQDLYPGVELVHKEENDVVKILKMQYPELDSFVYYQGVQGPIKIWEINPGEDILVREEFLSTSGGYGDFDNLQFVG